MILDMVDSTYKLMDVRDGVLTSKTTKDPASGKLLFPQPVSLVGLDMDDVASLRNYYWSLPDMATKMAYLRMLPNEKLSKMGCVDAKMCNEVAEYARYMDKGYVSDSDKEVGHALIQKGFEGVTKVVAYKYVTKDMMSPISTERIKYEVGKTFEAPYDPSPFATCVIGLHVATLAWCKQNKDSNSILLKVVIDPADIVSFHETGKFRVKKFFVEAIV